MLGVVASWTSAHSLLKRRPALYPDKMGVDAEQNKLKDIKETKFGSGAMRATVIRSALKTKGR
jgi:hypothetical protein